MSESGDSLHALVAAECGSCYLMLGTETRSKSENALPMGVPTRMNEQPRTLLYRRQWRIG